MVNDSNLEMSEPSIPQTGMAGQTLTALRELLSVGSQVAPAVARRTGLSETELHALELLHDSATGPADLARRMSVTTAASTGIVDRLAARGHVVRRPHPSDGRRTDVEITPSGRAELIGQLTPMFIALRELDAGLSPEEARVVQQYLRGAAEALRRVL